MKATNISARSVTEEMGTPRPPLLTSTPNRVTAMNEQNNALKQKDLGEEFGGLSSLQKDSMEEEVIRTNATIGEYVHNGAHDSLGCVAPNHDLPTLQSPITKGHPA